MDITKDKGKLLTKNISRNINKTKIKVCFQELTLLRHKNLLLKKYIFISILCAKMSRVTWALWKHIFEWKVIIVCLIQILTPLLASYLFYFYLCEQICFCYQLYSTRAWRLNLRLKQIWWFKSWLESNVALRQGR